jgi:TolA-binding protein
VVADAERRGLSLTLAQGGRDDLAALADAARYSRRNAIARRALHALRDRFATSERARDAAFFLGRLEEADDARSPRSLEWYRRYRTEAPHGLYVSDSLGREMLIMKRLYGQDAARPVAREYLERFPRGHLATQAAVIANPNPNPRDTAAQ